MAWSGSDTQSNVAGYRFYNKGFEPVWLVGKNFMELPNPIYHFNECGENRYAAQAMDWAGNWGAVSPSRAMLIATRFDNTITDARSVPLPGARGVGNGADWLVPSTVSNAAGRFVGDSCFASEDSPMGFDKPGYVQLYHSYTKIGGVGRAILHTNPISLNPWTGQEWQAAGPWAATSCLPVEHCPIDGLTLGRAPGTADSQRSESSFTTEIDLSETTAMHAMTLNFMLSMEGRSGSPNLLVLTAQADGDAEPTILWQRKGTNLKPTNVWVDMNAWRGKKVTLVYKLTTEFAVPLSLAIVSNPVISDWLTPHPKLAAIASEGAASADAGNVMATALMTITGENFIAPVTVRFGTTSATVISATESTIVAQIPATLAPGVYDVVVANLGGQSAALPDAWFVGRQVWLPNVRYD